MNPLDSELRTIEAAEALALTLGSDPNHTVAAAAMDAAGNIHSAVNVFHFTGGPCAEVVAVGLAASKNAGPLITIAAAGDRGRGLIPPCGRCRQILLDLHPDVLVAVPTQSGPQMRPIRTLLPDTYFFPDANAARIVRFNQRYYEDVRTGLKSSTVRWNDPIAVGPALLVFEGHPNHATLQGNVLKVESFPLADLTPSRARLSEGSDMSAFRASLREHYPEMPNDAVVDVVNFELSDS